MLSQAILYAAREERLRRRESEGSLTEDDVKGLRASKRHSNRDDLTDLYARKALGRGDEYQEQTTVSLNDPLSFFALLVEPEQRITIARAINALEGKIGIWTIADLKCYLLSERGLSPRDLLKIAGVGRRSVELMKEVLQRHLS